MNMKRINNKALDNKTSSFKRKEKRKMAQKRMFSNLVVGSDDFLEMPDSSQNLYFHLSMQADDDGFVDNWKSIMRMTGKKEDDLKLLIAKSFVIPFESGILVIRHWRLNNYIQRDRYKETIHKDEKALLSMDKNNVYNLDTDCIQNVSSDKISIDKNSIEKNSSSSVNEILYDSKVEEIQKVMIETIGTTNINNIHECISYLNKLPIELIEYALRKTARVERPSWQYTIPILESYIKKGFKTVEEVQADDLKFKNKNTNTGETEEERQARIIKELEGG